MLVCALDIGSKWMTLVALLDTYSPVLVEAKTFRRDAPPFQVVSLLKKWEGVYELEPHLVACRQQRWPCDLLDTLSSVGYPVSWLPRSIVVDLQTAWNETQPDRGLLRGWLMAGWRAVTHSREADVAFSLAAVECVRMILEDRLMELEAHTRPVPLPPCTCASPEERPSNCTCLHSDVPF